MWEHFVETRVLITRLHPLNSEAEVRVRRCAEIDGSRLLLRLTHEPNTRILTRVKFRQKQKIPLYMLKCEWETLLLPLAHKKGGSPAMERRA